MCVGGKSKWSCPFLEFRELKETKRKCFRVQATWRVISFLCNKYTIKKKKKNGSTHNLHYFFFVFLFFFFFFLSAVFSCIYCNKQTHKKNSFTFRILFPKHTHTHLPLLCRSLNSVSQWVPVGWIASTGCLFGFPFKHFVSLVIRQRDTVISYETTIPSSYSTQLCICPVYFLNKTKTSWLENIHANLSSALANRWMFFDSDNFAATSPTFECETDFLFSFQGVFIIISFSNFPSKKKKKKREFFFSFIGSSSSDE